MRTLISLFALLLSPFLSAAPGDGDPALAPITTLERTVDLDIGESQHVVLSDGRSVEVRLVDLQEIRDPLREAVREARVRVEVDGVPITLISAMYHLPRTLDAVGVQIDCSVTHGYLAGRPDSNPWALEKAARLRLWPAGSPWIEPGTLGYPVRQRWFASSTQMANEPVFVNGGRFPGADDIYYHYGLDIGGAEHLTEVVAATDGVVVSAAGKVLPEYAEFPTRRRADVVCVIDGRGWYFGYSHLSSIDVTPGQRVSIGDPIGKLGKEGASGGWSHLHFDIRSRQPSGAWGVQDGYTYLWQSYLETYDPDLIAVARPHQLAAIRTPVTLDGRKSWSRLGEIKTYEWTLADGTVSTGTVVEHTYDRPGSFQEILKVTDADGNEAWDFCTVQVLDPDAMEAPPPTLHAAYYPTQGLKVGDEITFKVRSFRTKPTGETWDFGDGSPAVTVYSDARAVNHAPDGYGIATHRYEKPGPYIATVTHVNDRDERAVARVLVEVQ